MHWTLAGDFDEFGLLFGRHGASQFDRHVDPVQHAFLGFAFFAILRVNARVPQRNDDIFERPLFPPRVQTDGHRCANTKRDKQIVIRGWRGICAARGRGFVGAEMMFPADDFL